MCGRPFVIASLLVAASVLAQDGRQAFQALVAQADQLEPPRRLGMRSALHTTLHRLTPDVVIVPDEASYLRAIAAWDPNTFFPVLIDDGTSKSRENIARFVRAFDPRSVVRWSTDDAMPAPGLERRRLIDRTVGAAWRLDAPEPTQAALVEWWLSLGVRPAGLVIADDSDPAWTAAVALAAARAQPIAWLPVGGAPRHVMPAAQAESLAARIRAECAATGLSFYELGDDIDAVTLCQSMPCKIDTGGGDVVALTDAIVRDADQPELRWAWAGQIFGDAQQAAYMAMCAVFLQPSDAWLFDGYPNQEPFSHWDATKAGQKLEQYGYDVRVLDEPAGDATTWRREAMGPVDADLIFVNTQGMRVFFDVNQGRLFSGDVPVLQKPAIVHFVHSWSAAAPDARKTIAGRWLERGAYAYFGSVQEPFLQAFVPTPMVALRLSVGFAWGAAPRLDEGPPWRVALFGDPLMVVSGVQRHDGALPLEGAVDVESTMRDAAARMNEPDASPASVLNDLIVLGRDADAIRLAAALLDQRPEAMTPECAAIAIPPAFRLRRADLVIDLYAMLPRDAATDRVLRDYLWLAASPWNRTLDERTVEILGANLRDDQLGADAVALAGPMARHVSTAAAIRMLENALRSATLPADTKMIEDRLTALRAGR